jgi:aryl-alcohol dehydrogenase-like predicted oxidoreductase
MERAMAPIALLEPPRSLPGREIETGILPFVLRENIAVIACSPQALAQC